MAEIVSLSEAIALAVHDGDTVAMEGFTHLIPHAAGHEVIRQRRRNLTLVRMTPDVIYDQMIGAGCASKLIFSWGGNPGVGSLHRFRDAVQNSWPGPLELEEHSHAGMANRYVAGASGLPFAVLRGYSGTSLATRTPNIAGITCPFTGERLTAVAALTPDVTVIHAQRADRAGMSSSGGSPACRRKPSWPPGAPSPPSRRSSTSYPAARRHRPAVLDGRLRGNGPRRRAPLLRARLHDKGQRLLPGLGPDQPGPREIPPLAGRARLRPERGRRNGPVTAPAAAGPSPGPPITPPTR